MTDNERPSSILQLPEELTKDVVLDLEITQDLLLNHVMVAVDPLLSVLQSTYAGLLDIRFEGNRLLVLKSKDNGELAGLLSKIQSEYDEETEA